MVNQRELREQAQQRDNATGEKPAARRTQLFEQPPEI